MPPPARLDSAVEPAMGGLIANCMETSIAAKDGGARLTEAAEMRRSYPKSIYELEGCAYDLAISSADVIMPFSACTAELFKPYARVAPIRSTISVSGLMSG